MMSRYRFPQLVAVLLVAMALVACSGTTATPSGAPGGGSAASGVTVSMKGLAFDPSSADVPVGGTVTFINDDSVQHDVAGESWSSGPMEPGASYTATFSNAGAVAVNCLFHPSMTMTVNVK